MYEYISHIVICCNHKNNLTWCRLAFSLNTEKWILCLYIKYRLSKRIHPSLTFLYRLNEEAIKLCSLFMVLVILTSLENWCIRVDKRKYFDGPEMLNKLLYYKNYYFMDMICFYKSIVTSFLNFYYCFW